MVCIFIHILDLVAHAWQHHGIHAPTQRSTHSADHSCLGWL